MMRYYDCWILKKNDGCWPWKNKEVCVVAPSAEAAGEKIVRWPQRASNRFFLGVPKPKKNTSIWLAGLKCWTSYVFALLLKSWKLSTQRIENDKNILMAVGKCHSWLNIKNSPARAIAKRVEPRQPRDRRDTISTCGWNKRTDSWDDN